MRIQDFVPEVFKRRTKLLTDKSYREIDRLMKIPRYTPCETTLLGERIQITDARSFLYGYEEIFVKKNYHFKASNESPLIIDCGANVGLSVAYFKKAYPKSKIIAFEPDPVIFKTLQNNVSALGLKDVTLEEKAVWIENSAMTFHSEGGFSGRLSDGKPSQILTEVKTIRLKDWIDQKINFLKIDIEGAETDVIVDCADKLKNIDYLFIEYHSFLGKDQTLQDILDIVKRAGFRYHIKEAYTVETPFTASFSGETDLQLDIFAFRV